MICRTYQSVLRSDVFATTTSLRMPSTSCAYQSGNVSLSPTVTSTPYGPTELSRSAAKSRVSVWPLRGALDQLVKSGTSASASSGDATFQPRAVGMTTSVLPTRSFTVPTIAAIDSHTNESPSAAHTPHAEKLQR